jgi:hypothetical protein
VSFGRQRKLVDTNPLFHRAVLTHFTFYLTQDEYIAFLKLDPTFEQLVKSSIAQPFEATAQLKGYEVK